MAGIGFPLLKIYERNNLGSRIQAVGHAMFIASGPSLMTILCFVLVTVFTRGVATEEVVGFRVAVVYAFALAFIVATPVSLISARLVSNAFSRRDFSNVRGTYCTALTLAAVGAGACATLVFGFHSGWQLEFTIPAAALTALVCALLVGASFATAVREFRAVTLSFALGAAISCALVVAAIWLGMGEGAIMAAFHAGLLVALFGISLPLFATFPDNSQRVSGFVRTLGLGLFRYRVLALGGLAGAFAIWVDKFILWQGGVATGNGLLHLPPYDSSIFIAYLLILPGLSMFLVLSETELFRGFRRYQNAIDNRGTLRQINSELYEIADKVTRLIFRLTLVQVFVALIAILGAPLLIELFGLSYGQLPTLRILILASAFQFAFMACGAVVLFVGDVRSYAVVQLSFLTLNTLATIGIQFLAPELTGLGYLIACAGASALAYGTQLRSINNLNADILARA